MGALTNRREDFAAQMRKRGIGLTDPGNSINLTPISCFDGETGGDRQWMKAGGASKRNVCVRHNLRC